ncbi:SIR2 family NAD-dependent protein deacylase [Burkholderia sp. Ac-20379]|uniref:SIR2 family NAD-dependent protein deacylase n=1 Tax=Burkholderia sp. Ac-20379 TaxID=2703900 RepID=UPI001981F403|nr:Sir2 family NAD-dependent protein deacetylase [Burkholderia sp. Ac-20379]MBN3725311.1 RNA polymerase subunit sigma [Burkholderia sp. Ac-20379]
MSITHTSLARAARWIADADALVITAGAGMSVDSNLPDFRGTNGIWQTLLPAGMHEGEVGSFTQGDCFTAKPRDAWRFFGRALDVCRATVPHDGYALLRHWAATKRHGAFVYTSNVDGLFQAAGFEEARMLECHGSLHHFQCARPCSPVTWPAPDCIVPGRPPRCIHCGGPARPNFLLFSDPSWVVARTNAQRLRMEQWRGLPANAVVIEIGAGTALPTVRMFSESLRLPLVRINLHDAGHDDGRVVSLQGTALDVLQRLGFALRAAGGRSNGLKPYPIHF